MEKEKDNFETKPIAQLANYNFYVEDYQRGYKWTPQQVVDLLNDINEFDAKSTYYCIQPLVVIDNHKPEVKKLFEDTTSSVFEVVDGQQRLTSIYILQKILKESIYNIRYKTRIESADFLENINMHLSKYHIDDSSLINDLPKLNKELNIKWNELILANASINNIDNFHFFSTYLTINAWLTNNYIDTNPYYNKVNNEVRFIWYKETHTNNVRELFRDLNDGKIELTNAELIKALFINSIKDDNKEIQILKQTELATDWDRIENELQDDAFFYFMSAQNASLYQTRIDLLFEIEVNRPKKYQNDHLYSYRFYDKESLEYREEAWKNIKQLYQNLKEWYSDTTTYHLIGYILHLGLSDIHGIVNLSKDIRKQDFKLKLKEIIKVAFSEKTTDEQDKEINVYAINNLNYENDKKAVTNTLLLFNILTYELAEPDYRFPFDKLKNTNSWHLEHIHAKKTEALKTVHENTEWLNGILLDMEKQNITDKALRSEVNEISERLSNENPKAKLPKDMATEMNDLIDSINEAFDIDSINNLALLDGSTNCSIGNGAFNEKRKEIIRLDKQNHKILINNKPKPFIPITTKHVFLKYYSKNVQQLDYWSPTDRADYITEMSIILADYLPKIKKKNHE